MSGFRRAAELGDEKAMSDFLMIPTTPQVDYINPKNIPNLSIGEMRTKMETSSDAFGNTGLHLAARGGHLEIVQMILVRLMHLELSALGPIQSRPPLFGERTRVQITVDRSQLLGCLISKDCFVALIPGGQLDLTGRVKSGFRVIEAGGTRVRTLEELVHVIQQHPKSLSMTFEEVQFSSTDHLRCVRIA